MKTVNLISAISNGAGLERDVELLANIIESLGHRWQKIAYDRPFTGLNYKADISIFLEVMVPEMLNWAPQNWLIPNSEWWSKNGDCALPFISKILCKTHDCYNIWNRKCPDKCIYTGFESMDFLAQPLPFEKENNFLHLAGNSRTKNTEAVVQAWRQYQIPYNLEIIIRDISFIPQCLGVKNVTYHARISDDQVRCALNVRQFHLMPSHYEGYGHSIHEALACGGIVLTTDAPPMNEFEGIPKELLVPSYENWTKELALCHTVAPESVYKAVMKAGELSIERRNELSLAARAAFLKERDEFRARISELLK